MLPPITPSDPYVVKMKGQVQLNDNFFDGLKDFAEQLFATSSKRPTYNRYSAQNDRHGETLASKNTKNVIDVK